MKRETEHSSQDRGTLTIVLALAVAAFGVTGAAAQSFGRAAVQAPPETLTEGISAEEHLARQQRLHAWLLGELPSEALSAPVRIQLTPEERKELERPAPSGPGPLRIGLVKQVAPPVQLSGLDRLKISDAGRPHAGGILRSAPDGGFVWAAAVASEEAGGLRVHVSDFHLPPGADLYFFSLDGEAYGPYQRQGPGGGGGDFWTHSVFASQGVILLIHFGPASPDELRQMSLTIAEVGHIGPLFPQAVEQAAASFCGNPSCVIDASCATIPAAIAPARDAVAKMEWISGAFIFTCTGGLIADSDAGTEIPYFLTANHCISANKDAQNMEAFFFYRTQRCGESCPSDSGFPKTLGASVKVTGRAGDFTLLQLSQKPPTGAVLLGWTSAPVAFSNGVDLFRISHPNFGAQVYSRHDVDTSAPTCSGWPRGERIYSRDIEGATDGGSSGSPVLNGSGQIVGQLSGSCGFNVNDPCDAAANATVDGAFAFYFDQVAPFLGAGGGGGCTLGQTGDPCSSNSDCCSNKCRGPAGGKTCR